MCRFSPTAACLLTLFFCAAATAQEFPRQLKNGLGMDLPVGQRGNFHLTIHERGNPEKIGLRFALREREFHTRMATWSFGPVLKAMRSAEHGNHITLIPQLRAEIPVGTRTAHAFIHYGYWTTDGKRTPVPERTIQAQVQMRF